MSDGGGRVQLYWYRGRWVIRAPPCGPPSPAQLRAREAFAATARTAKGEKRTGPLPPAAQAVAKELAGKTFGGASSVPMWRTLLVQFLVRRGYSSDDAEAIVAAIQKMTL